MGKERGKVGCLQRLRRQKGNINGMSERAATSCELLSLTVKHVKMLRRSFDKIDLDDSGEIDYFEFTEMCGELRSPFTTALFRMIDHNESGTLDFDEYVAVATLYCSYTQGDILTFAFNTFDKDGSGTIDEDEFMDLARMINAGSPLFPGNFGRALSMFDKNDDGLLDFREFEDINRQFPMMLFPAFRLQDGIQKATLGTKEWVRIMRKLKWQDYCEAYAGSHNGRRPKPTLSQWWNDHILLGGKQFVRPADTSGASAKKKQRAERGAKRKATKGGGSSAKVAPAGTAAGGGGGKKANKLKRNKSLSPKGGKSNARSPKGASPKGDRKLKRRESKRSGGVKMSL